MRKLITAHSADLTFEKEKRESNRIGWETVVKMVVLVKVMNEKKRGY